MECYYSIDSRSIIDPYIVSILSCFGRMGHVFENFKRTLVWMYSHNRSSSPCIAVKPLLRSNPHGEIVQLIIHNTKSYSFFSLTITLPHDFKLSRLVRTNYSDWDEPSIMKDAHISSTYCKNTFSNSDNLVIAYFLQYFK